MITDPIEKIVEGALKFAGIKYLTGDEGDNPSGLDFLLPDHGVEIEVKQFHSERISRQMARVPNVIVIQGKDAALFFANLICHHLPNTKPSTIADAGLGCIGLE